MLKKMTFDIARWYPGVPIYPHPRGISFAHPLSHVDFDRRRPSLTVHQPVFKAHTDSKLKVSSDAVEASDVPARYLAHHIAAFIHPTTVIVRLDEGCQRYKNEIATWALVADLRKICRTFGEVQLETVNEQYARISKEPATSEEGEGIRRHRYQWWWEA
jgi:hypothetical protein